MASHNCTDCGIGEYSGEGASSCLACPAGYWSDATGAAKCEPCPAGTSKGAGAGACKDCLPNTYAPKNGSSSCPTCSWPLTTQNEMSKHGQTPYRFSGSLPNRR